MISGDEAHKKELKQSTHPWCITQRTGGANEHVEEENQQILFSHVESQVVKNSRLNAENEELKQQLEVLCKDAPATSDAANLDQPTLATTSVPTDEHGQLSLRYEELSKKYQDLSQKIKYLERKNTAVMQKNKDMKESVRAWQEYADRQAGKQKPKNEAKAVEDLPRLSAVPLIDDARPSMPSSPRSVGTIRTPPSFADRGQSSPTPMPPLTSTELVDRDAALISNHYVVNDNEDEDVVHQDDSVTPKQLDYSRPAAHQSTCDDQSPVVIFPTMDESTLAGGCLQTHLRNNPGSSQTTEDESTQQATRPAALANDACDDDDDDDDAPQFVSARSLKRKRSQQPKIGTHGQPYSDGTPIKPFRVKEEPASSPPHAHSLSRKDTIDLDDPTSTLLKTPRHAKRRNQTLLSMVNACRHPRSSSAPFSQNIKQEQSASEIMHRVSDAVLQTDQVGPMDAASRSRSEPSDPNDSVSNVLRHLDPNVITVPQAENSNKRVKHNEVGSEGAHGIFAESGEQNSALDENINRLSPTAARAKINRNRHSPQPRPVEGQPRSPTITEVKLEQSLGSPSSSRPTQIRLTRSRLRNPHFAVDATPRDDSNTTDGRRQWTMKAQQPHQSARKSPISRQTYKGPLRQKDLTELTRQDFKPNPEYNHGYTHAFSETMRKRGDRMCLPGCTNPDCCGSAFRTFAAALVPLPLSQEEALLEDYLGEAYDNMNLTQMSLEERQELVLQARTRKIAKDTGKHRETYERRRTPPGFWRVDFPTTQEQQEDREKAEDQEKQVVRERWLEAQRKGGRWIYQDE